MTLIQGIVLGVVALLASLLGLEEHRITKLEAQVTTLQTENKDATDRFHQDALAKTKEYQDDLSKGMADLAERDKHIVDLSSRIGLLNGSISTYSRGHNSLVPSTPSTACPTDRSEVLGRLLESCNGLLGRGATSAQSASGQIAALGEVCR